MIFIRFEFFVVYLGRLVNVSCCLEFLWNYGLVFGRELKEKVCVWTVYVYGVFVYVCVCKVYGVYVRGVCRMYVCV